jgi:hypothetical protein
VTDSEMTLTCLTVPAGSTGSETRSRGRWPAPRAQVDVSARRSRVDPGRSRRAGVA